MAGQKEYTFTPEGGKPIVIKADSQSDALAAYKHALANPSQFGGEEQEATPSQVPQWEGPEPTMQEQNIMGQDRRSQDRRANMAQRGEEFPKEAAAVGDAAYRNKASIAGTMVGSLGGVPGMIAGGAAGSAVDDLINQGVPVSELKFASALQAAGVSVGIDVLTLGIGRYAAGPLWAAFKRRVGQGEPIENIVKEMAAKAGPDAANVGSKESKLQTQALLNEGGETLSKHQLGLNDGLGKFMETVGRGGILSGGVFRNSALRIEEMIKTRMSSLVGDDAVAPGTLGFGLEQMGEAAKTAMNALYGKRLDILRKDMGNKNISYDTVNNVLANWHKSKGIRTEVGGTKLGDIEIKLIDDLTAFMKEAKSGSPGQLLSLDAKLGELLPAAFKSASGPEALRLVKFKDKLKAALAVNMKQAHPRAGEQFRRLQKDHAVNMQGVFPSINKAFISRNGVGNIEALGKMFSLSGKSENIKAAMSGIDQAYAAIRRNAVSKDNAWKDLPYKSPEEAKAAVGRAYAGKRLGSLTDDELNTSSFVKEAYALANDEAQIATAKAALGVNFNNYKKLVNALAHSTDTPKSGSFALVHKGKEVGTIAKLLGSITTGGSLLATGAASVVFGAPHFIAKMATNPNHVNRIIAASRMGPKSEAKAIKLLSTVANDVIEEMYDAGELSSEEHFKLTGGE